MWNNTLARRALLQNISTRTATVRTSASPAANGRPLRTRSASCAPLPSGQAGRSSRSIAIMLCQAPRVGKGRPAFDRMCKDAVRRKFDVVAAWSVDRLGRSLQDLVGFRSELHTTGVDLFLHQQGIDTTSPAGKAMFQMMGVFAEFERAMIRDRVNAGFLATHSASCASRIAGASSSSSVAKSSSCWQSACFRCRNANKSR